MKYSIRIITSTTVFFLLLNCTQVLAQSVGIGTDLPNPNAALHIEPQNGDQGVIITRLTDTEITTLAASLGTIDQGLLVFNSSTNKFNVWTGTTWELVGYGDDLGNHTATTHITLKDNWISNDGDKEGISVSDNGNVIIANSNTNTTQVNGALQVSNNSIIDGSVTTTNVIYSTPISTIKSIAPSSWVLGAEKTAALLAKDLFYNGIQLGPAYSTILAPVELPHKSILTKVECYMENTSPLDANLRFYQADNSGGTLTSLGGVSKGGTSGWLDISTTGFSKLPWDVNNQKLHYFLMIEEPVVSPLIKVKGCRLTYTQNAPD